MRGLGRFGREVDERWGQKKLSRNEKYIKEAYYFVSYLKHSFFFKKIDF